MAAKEKVKLQVSVSRELCERIDALAREIGMDRSQLCAYFIGKQVKQEEMQSHVLDAFMEQISPALLDVFRSSVSKAKVIAEASE